ncbi:MAG: hypothetical protein KatS3mg105_0970 [Gemmatales bacterium]|nr:MAG: hypothetical protein KatS3mg105_0970 [Gemmatales bacterium]
MIRKYVLPVLAFALFSLAVVHVIRASKPLPKLKPPIEPAHTPFAKTVAGAGIIEARTENIAIGSDLPGIVTRVFVKVGEKVTAGTKLFQLDDRALRAELAVREAALAAAKAEWERLKNLPRPEELKLKEARLREAKAHLEEQRDLLNRALASGRSISPEELSRRRQAFHQAQGQYDFAVADYELLKAGAWERELAVAEANVRQAKAQVEQVRTDIERLTVRALVAGEVLQVNVRPGEYVGAPPSQALIVLGDVHLLHVRVDIDEYDIPRFVPGAPAKAVLRGHADIEFPLTFVRVEPFVVPKKSLTGDNSERVDTRVLQVIYAFEPSSWPVYVGQQVDVFIDAAGKSSIGSGE